MTRKPLSNVRFISLMWLEFNKLVESSLAVIESIVGSNMTKEEVEEFLASVSIIIYFLEGECERGV